MDDYRVVAVCTGKLNLNIVETEKKTTTTGNNSNKKKKKAKRKRSQAAIAQSKECKTQMKTTKTTLAHVPHAT